MSRWSGHIPMTPVLSRCSPLGLAGLLVLAFRFGAARNARSKALLALRAAALGVLVLILLNPTREEHVTHTGPAADGGFPARRIPEHEPGISDQPVAGCPTRSSNERRAWCPADRRPAIQKYGFGRDLFAISEPADGRRAVADRNAAGLGPGAAPGRFGETLPFGVFVFSDGRSTEPEPLDVDGPGLSRAGGADSRRPAGRRADLGRRRRPGHRRAPRRPAGHARAGPGDPAQPRSRRRAHRARASGRTPARRGRAGDASRHAG